MMVRPSVVSSSVARPQNILDYVETYFQPFFVSSGTSPVEHTKFCSVKKKDTLATMSGKGMFFICFESAFYYQKSLLC